MNLKYTGREVPRARPSEAEMILGKPSLSDFLCIRVAGNEQQPLDFNNSEYIKAERGPIKTFDYALCGDEDNFAIERKSLPDWTQSVVMASGWKHELAKIERARSWLLPIIYILEFNWEDIFTFDYGIFKSGKVTSQMVARRWAEMVYDLGVCVDFAGSRKAAAYKIALLLKRRKESLKASVAGSH